jgi:predicted amidohydrolase
MVKVAAYQLTPASSIEARKEQMHDALKQAEKNFLDFICFPEGFLTGYFAEEDLARKHSLEVGDAQFDAWLSITKTYSATVIVGFNEREGGALFDSAAVFEKGALLGIQRKHYLYHNYFTPGSTFTPFRSKGVTFGVVICLDTTCFEPCRLLALQGASLIFTPMCNKVAPSHPYATRPPYYSHLVARSFENRCWLLSSDWVWPNDGQLVCPGNSVLYDSNGQEVARAQEGKEDLLIYDIPQEQLSCKKGRRVYGSPLLSKQMQEFKVNSIS